MSRLSKHGYHHAMKLGNAISQTLALDIGGANIKACYCDQDGELHSFFRLFLLSRQVEDLVETLRCIVDQCAQQPRRWLVTMTGELCDCFLNRKQGVHAILDAVSVVAEGLPVHVWSTTDGFVDIKEARENPSTIASANWHALASCLALYHADQRLVLIDTGSTTTDIIPIIKGNVTTIGKTDAQRLLYQELVYLGGSLTPLMALSAKTNAALMNEFFATMHDLAVVIGAYPQQLDNGHSPDGMPYDKASCLRRILRMVGQDLNDDWKMSDHEGVVECLLDAAVSMIRSAFEVVADRHHPVDAVMISGSGSWLPLRMLEQMGNPFETRTLEGLWGGDMSTCACARALIELSSESD